jgi:glycosyltransferase involved in cell wall biosynthesis
MPSPLFSIIAATYNRGPRIRVTIDSVLAQTLAVQCEILIVDDGSTDDTPLILQEYSCRHSNLQVIRQRNGGVARARNRGLHAARGNYIAFLDHDDIWLPDKLEKQLAALQGRPDAAVVYCRWIDVDEAGELLPNEQQTTKQSWWQPREGWVHDWFCAPRNPIISMSVPLIRADALRAVGRFDPAMVPADDLDLWLRLSERHTFAYLPEQLVLYVHHAKQQGSDPTRAARAMRRVYAKHWRSLLRHPAMLWYVITFRFFIRSAPLYQRAKIADPLQMRCLIVNAVRRHPLALFSPQWMVLLFRYITGCDHKR